MLLATFGHNLTEVNFELNKEFHDIDTDKNNFVNLQEFEARITSWDANKDGCVTQAEFFSSHSSDSLKFEWELFNHFDHNSDGCIEVEDDIAEFHEIDVNPKDNKISLQEYDAEYDKVLERIGFLNINQP
ncbi:uncharacterized protein LOC132744328 [Ruditapes philippinarum]|uniref:uncharacterized protein LOC132744328 n=1 Tax=Ruditapes philippinarum TaxID=129788 RepID=UPI00295A6AE1|nr:uncharacterized protein LOC132744328 [Ruditapes philippinarum]